MNPDEDYAPTMRATAARRYWPHIRALLIGLHLFVIVLLSLPSSHRLGDRAHWNKPAQQADLARWAGTLGVEPKRLDAFVWKWTQRYVALRKSVSRPFLKLVDYTGTRQGWTMFSGPRRRTGRYDVEVEVDGEYQSVFRTQDGAATWNRRQFEHNRLRKLMAKLTSHPQLPAYSEFTRWVAGRVAEDFPRATRCKVTLYTWKTLDPAEHRAGEIPFETRSRSQMFSLEDLR